MPLVLALVLGEIHRIVGGIHQRLHVHAVAREDADADRTRDLHLDAVDQHGLGQRLEHPLRNLRGLGTVGELRQQHGRQVPIFVKIAPDLEPGDLDDIVRVAFVDAASPGRLQVVSREPLTIVDGAHNPHGVRSLAKALKSSFGAPKAVAVIGVLAGKNADEMLEVLAGSFEHVVLCAAKSDRALVVAELQSLAIKYWGETKISVASSVAKAIQDARELAANEKLEAIVITGSLTVVGEALTFVQEENLED